MNTLLKNGDTTKGIAYARDTRIDKLERRTRNGRVSKNE